MELRLRPYLRTVSGVLIEVRHGVRLGVSEKRAVLAVPTPKPAKGTAFPPRRLRLRGAEVFELSLWCGTCPVLFRKLSQPARADLGVANDRLAAGLDGIDDAVLRAYGDLLPESTYTVMLVELLPRLVVPGDAGDYFAHEQVTTWGLDHLGAGADPGTSYYRSFEARVDEERHLYEFVVPMVPPGWNDSSTFAAYEAMAAPTPPTAVAYSLLDVIAPAVDLGTDWYWHWLLQHFLLDGHHKIAAAARRRQPIRLLSLLDEDISMATREDIRRMLKARSQPEASRGKPEASRG
jgi:hypothetical protein